MAALGLAGRLPQDQAGSGRRHRGPRRADVPAPVEPPPGSLPPEAYRKKFVYTDFYSVYFAVLPEQQHRPCAKGSGQTNKVERFNNTLRQRLARFVRKTLSFSKSPKMHWYCLLLFLHEYNRYCRYCIERFGLTDPT